MLSSVMARLLESVGESDEFVIGQRGDGLRLGGTHRPPHIDAVRASSAACDALGQASLVGVERLDTHWRCVSDEVASGLSKAWRRVVRKYLGTADQAPMLAAHGSPHQRAILGVELLYTPVGLDHLRSGDAATSLLGARHARTTASDQAAAAITPGSAAHQPYHRHARKACLHHGAHDLRDRELTGVCFLQTHTAGVEQDQHWHRFYIARGPQQTR